MARGSFPGLALLLLLALFYAPAPSSGLSNVVSSWNEALEMALGRYSIPFQIGFKYYAMLHQAQLLALKSGNHASSSDPLLQKAQEVNLRGRESPQNGTPDSGATERALAASSSHAVLSRCFPGLQTPVFDPLLAAHTEDLTPSLLSSVLDQARRIAADVFAKRIDDGTQAYVHFQAAAQGSPAGDYQWSPGQNTTFMPQLGDAQAFYAPVSSIDLDQYWPLDASSDEFRHELNDTYTLGRRTSTSDFISQTADFWFEGPWSYASHFNHMVLGLLPGDASEYDTALALLLANAAGFDAAVAAWKLKYLRLFWRPITAVQQGLKGFSADWSWVPHEATRPFPEYPSGHSTMAGAIGGIIKHLTNSANVTITSHSYNLDAITGQPLEPRTYESIDAMVDEVGWSRVYAGVHYLSSCKDGARLGKEVSKLILQNFDF